SFHALAGSRSNGHPGWGGLPFAQYTQVRRMICRPAEGSAYKEPLLVEADGEVLGASYTAIGAGEKTLRLLWPC
ncbi:MAG: hypothetical protein WBD46_19125, partial [Acidobacteriaceae bacterium]